MKIALLVFPIHYSHGCILQTYALYSKLKELGHDVTIIDRQPSKQSLLTNSIGILKRIVKRVVSDYRGPVFYSGYIPKAIMKNQQSFIDGFKESIISVYSTDELRKAIMSKLYDAVIVGSDQTWRPRNVPNVMDYWLDFASDLHMKKLAYAASFGVDVWEYTKEQTERCKFLSRQFDGLSTREISGVDLCKKYLDIDALHVLDPTMLWDNEFYTEFASKHYLEEGHCQCYFLDQSPEKQAIADKIAQIKKLKINYINTRTEDPKAPLKDRIAPSIEHWLAGFYYGEFIVVDSFHAMVFAIIFQKPFVVIGNRRRGMSRFESLLGLLGLKERLVTENTFDEALLEKQIDWTEVTNQLNRMRKTSVDFINDSLGENE